MLGLHFAPYAAVTCKESLQCERQAFGKGALTSINFSNITRDSLRCSLVCTTTAGGSGRLAYFALLFTSFFDCFFDSSFFASFLLFFLVSFVVGLDVALLLLWVESGEPVWL